MSESPWAVIKEAGRCLLKLAPGIALMLLVGLIAGGSD